MAKTYYLLIAAAAGMVVLALEVVAARTIAPALGSGPVSWSALLAVALGTLAAGNLAGGVLSDRVRAEGMIAWSLAAASACFVLLSQCYPVAIRWSAGLSLIAGAVAGATIILAVPVAALGTITPVILRGGDGKGSWAGMVLAAGSAGGIAGAMAAGLWLVPCLGLARSYLLLGVFLAGMAVPAVWQRRRWLAALLVLLTLGSAGVCWLRHTAVGGYGIRTYPPSRGKVIQSRHGQLEVRRTEAGRLLLIDGLPQTGLPGELTVTGILPGDGLRYGYLLEVARIMRPRAESGLVVGLGAGLAPRLLAAHGMQCETVEIDPAVVELARRQFGFSGRVAVADGRRFLAAATRQWDLIFLDVCTADRLPWHLFSVEALQIARDRLAPGGILVIQFIGDDGPWAAGLARTARTVFGNVQILVAPAHLAVVGPRWLFASAGRLPPLPDDLFFPGQRAPWQRVCLPDQGSLLTDDHFPAELPWAATARQWRSLYADSP